MTHAAPRLLVVAAFAAVYLIWGSTYLAIKVTLETLPPLAAGAARFLAAGALLYAFARLRGHAAPTARHWPGMAFVGGLLLLGGNGGLSWAQQHVPSGLASVVIASIPLFVTLIEALRPGAAAGDRPGPATFAGVGLGFGGIALLVAERHGAPAEVPPGDAAVLLGAAFCWALGSVGSRHVPLPPSILVSIAGQMLAGGALLVVASGLLGEWPRVDLAGASARSLGALAYLVGFGSLVAYSAYVWLLRAVAPTRVATYAYVNPIVALLLGWALAGEALSGTALAAAGLTIAGVVVIVTARAARSAPRDEAPPTSPPGEVRESSMLMSYTPDPRCYRSRAHDPLAPGRPRDQRA
ncbi:MAG: EamA family transporter [Planctomycetes bacterium]|nr:EamA family transporter [Planctomycetota bacterium]